MSVNKLDAILAIKSDAEVVSVAGGSLNWIDGNPTNITEEQIATKLAELQVDYDALAYARKRQAAYPSKADFMEAYTEKEIGGDSTKWDAYVINYNKVRTENPK
jgi:hypothetical protein